MMQLASMSPQPAKRRSTALHRDSNPHNSGWDDDTSCPMEKMPIMIMNSDDDLTSTQPASSSSSSSCDGLRVETLRTLVRVATKSPLEVVQQADVHQLTGMAVASLLTYCADHPHEFTQELASVVQSSATASRDTTASTVPQALARFVCLAARDDSTHEPSMEWVVRLCRQKLQQLPQQQPAITQESASAAALVSDCSSKSSSQEEQDSLSLQDLSYPPDSLAHTNSRLHNTTASSSYPDEPRQDEFATPMGIQPVNYCAGGMAAMMYQSASLLSKAYQEPEKIPLNDTTSPPALTVTPDDRHSYCSELTDELQDDDSLLLGDDLVLDGSLGDRWNEEPVAVTVPSSPMRSVDAIPQKPLHHRVFSLPLQESHDADHECSDEEEAAASPQKLFFPHRLPLQESHDADHDSSEEEEVVFFRQDDHDEDEDSSFDSAYPEFYPNHPRAKSCLPPPETNDHDEFWIEPILSSHNIWNTITSSGVDKFVDDDEEMISWAPFDESEPLFPDDTPINNSNVSFQDMCHDLSFDELYAKADETLEQVLADIRRIPNCQQVGLAPEPQSPPKRQRRLCDISLQLSLDNNSPSSPLSTTCLLKRHDDDRGRLCTPSLSQNSHIWHHKSRKLLEGLRERRRQRKLSKQQQQTLDVVQYNKQCGPDEVVCPESPVKSRGDVAGEAKGMCFWSCVVPFRRRRRQRREF